MKILVPYVFWGGSGLRLKDIIPHHFYPMIWFLYPQDKKTAHFPSSICIATARASENQLFTCYLLCWSIYHCTKWHSTRINDIGVNMNNFTIDRCVTLFFLFRYFCTLEFFFNFWFSLEKSSTVFTSRCITELSTKHF